ncbi:MAG: hypothetical protein FWF02_15055 [Micrococcales bacterium]|nr:hypothetical protein [Micrococcales bacterium]MCL2668998.1 hypothetical protein [Micrococcales bacterium]
MTNVTITVDEATLKRARIRAIERGESVNQFLAEQLRRYADADDQRERQRRSLVRIGELADSLPRSTGGWQWNRDELYADRLGRFDQ